MGRFCESGFFPLTHHRIVLFLTYEGREQMPSKDVFLFQYGTSGRKDQEMGCEIGGKIVQ